MILFGVADTAIAFTIDFHGAVGHRVLQGIAFAGTIPVTIISIEDFDVWTREATAQGFRITSVGLSQTVFLIIAGLVVTVGGQYPSILYAIAILIAIGVQRWFTESKSTKAAGARLDPDNRSYRTALLLVIRKLHVLSYILARGFLVV